jgi:D-alanyl-D-alanine dipeptidase
MPRMLRLSVGVALLGAAAILLGGCKRPEAAPKPAASKEHSRASVKQVEPSWTASPGLVDVQTLNPAIQVDLAYASTSNFLHEDLYHGLRKCYLLEEAAAKLAKAQADLARVKPGYHLLACDCVRPQSVQRKMWARVKGTEMEQYVAAPSRVSLHSLGVAVDLTIVDANGERLDMGTPYDSFDRLAQPRYEREFLRSGKLSPQQVENRQLLRSVMVGAGFQSLSTEWWHFGAFPKAVAMRRYRPIE